MTTAALPQRAAMDSAVRYLVSKYSPKGNKVGWLMMASILVEAWDLFLPVFSSRYRCALKPNRCW